MDHRHRSTSTAFWANELSRRLAQPDGQMTPQEIAEIVQVFYFIEFVGGIRLFIAHSSDEGRWFVQG
jgi:hypothetical protein